MKLRFAPSPTGYLHVGGARTAIFNLLHARRHNGAMALRIEDTDVERSRQHHAEQIVSSLKWLGVEWDDGPIYQSDRLDRYRERANKLVELGLGYRCYCTVEELDADRAAGEAAGRAYRYSGRCRRKAEAGEAQPSDVPHVIRFKVEEGSIDFHDLTRGDVHSDAKELAPFVLTPPAAYPTSPLSVAANDTERETPPAARGDNPLSNTPKHTLLFEAF